MTAPTGADITRALVDRIVAGEHLPLGISGLDADTRAAVTSYAIARSRSAATIWPRLKRDTERHAAPRLRRRVGATTHERTTR